MTIETLKSRLDLRCLDEKHHIYLLCRRGNVVYIGQSSSVYARISTHRREGKDFDSAHGMAVPEGDVTPLECALIRYLKPEYNAVSVVGSLSAWERELLIEYGFMQTDEIVSGEPTYRPIPVLKAGDNLLTEWIVYRVDCALRGQKLGRVDWLRYYLLNTEPEGSRGRINILHTIGRERAA